MELALAEIRLYVHKRVMAQMSKVQMRRQKNGMGAESVSCAKWYNSVYVRP